MNSDTIALLQACRICPRVCGADRFYGSGYCGAGAELRINLAQLHYGEEPVISGSRGSGTIFFSHCNLKCVFCQNHPISQEGWGTDYSIEDCARLMLDLQDRGAHNINLVTPSHFSPQIRETLMLAKAQGLKLPIVWNSNAYELVETLQSMSGLVDIYLPDLKYAHPAYAKRYSSAWNYPELALNAIAEMQSQVGKLVLDSSGIAVKGLIIRLLVLPNRLAGTKQNLIQVAERIGTEVQLSLMAQYYPTHKAASYPELNRGITPAEYEEALDAAQELGFTNIWIQELSCSDAWTPRFTQEARL